MKYKKYGLLALTALLVGVPIGAGIYDSVNADEKQTDNFTEQKVALYTAATVTDNIFNEINDHLEKGNKLSQKELDDYTYYMYQYASGPQFISTEDDGVNMAKNGFETLIALYKLADIEPSFRFDDEKKTIYMNRELHKPEKRDEIVNEVKEKVEEAVKEESDTTNVDINVDKVVVKDAEQN